MNRTLVSGLGIVLLLVAAGCAAAAPATPQVQQFYGYAEPYRASGQPVGKSADETMPTAGQQVANAAGAERMIIYSGQLSLVVKDTRAAVEQITQIVKDAGGFVTSSNTYQDSGHTRAVMTVRIPGEDLAQLQATLNKIKALAVEVERESLNGQDVTDQYADTQAEIENLTAQRDSYRKLLDRATKMEDIINIQTKLDQVQGQINKLTGQQLKLKENVKFATVSITLTPDALAQPIAVGTWRPQGTARNALQLLIRSLQFLGDTLIVAGICGVPAVVMIGLPAYLIIRLVQARRRKKVAPPAS